MKIQESHNNYIVPIDAYDLALEQFIKRYGRLIEPIYGNDIEVKKDPEMDEFVEECIKKYNPQGLSIKEYQLAQELGELPWQNS